MRYFIWYMLIFWGLRAVMFLHQAMQREVPKPVTRSHADLAFGAILSAGTAMWAAWVLFR